MILPSYAGVKGANCPSGRIAKKARSGLTSTRTAYRRNNANHAHQEHRGRLHSRGLVVSCNRAGAAGLPDGLYARLTTSKGEVMVRLEYQKAPLTVGNFVGLAEGRLDASKGKKYFDGLSFHRVVKDFVVQTGDPRATASGGPGYEFPNEIAADLTYDAEGMVGMANAGPNTNGSQFFITMKPLRRT